MQTAEPTTRAPFGWWPAIVLAAVAFTDRLETNITAGVLPLLQAEWGFSDTLAGALPAAAAIATLLLVLPGGYLADRRRRTGILTVVVASWALLTVGSALALSFGMFFAIRALLGAADTIDTPAAQSLLADYHPPEARAMAYGVYRLAYFAGIPAGIFVGGVVGQLVGWRAAFLVSAVPALVIAVLCWRLPEPKRGGMDFAFPQAIAPAALAEQLIVLVRNRTLRLLHVGIGALFLGLTGIFFWLPSFYQRVYGVGEAVGGSYTAAVTLLGVLGGTFAGGWLGGRWHGVRRGWHVTVAGTGLLAGSAGMAAAFAVTPLGWHLALMTVGVACMSLAIPTLSAAVAEVVFALNRGLAFAGLQLIGTLGGVTGPLLVGVGADWTGSLRVAMQLLVVPIAAGALFVVRARWTYDDDLSAVQM